MASSDTDPYSLERDESKKWLSYVGIKYLLLLSPRHLCRLINSFRLSVHMFVRTSVEFVSKYISATI